MKHLTILCDGMADYPVKSLGGKTPLMAAHTPVMDSLAAEGSSGTFATIPEDLPPGSEVANLSVLGYDPHEDFCQRGVLEAASLGIEVQDGQLAMRCNLIYTEDDKIVSHSGGDLNRAQAKEIIDLLNLKLGSDRIRFYQGMHYRHLLIVDDALPAITCWPPHDNLGKSIHDLRIIADKPEADETANLLNKLVADSREILEALPQNSEKSKKRMKRPNLIWPWAAGEKPSMKSIKERTGLSGAVISAVDLIKGLGIYAGMDVIEVEGATGNYRTNYEGKAKAALDALTKYDYVYLHVEAADEAGHDGDIGLKVRVIDDLDARLISPIMDGIRRNKLKIKIALLPDHPTPVELRCHVKDPVPVLLWGEGIKADDVKVFDEEAAKRGSLGQLDHESFFKKYFGA